MAGRQIRVETAMRKEIANLMLYKMRDPRLAQATITGVKVSRDWSQAQVFVSSLGEEAELRAAVEALNSAAGFVRHQIAPALTLRQMPELEFLPDDTARKAQRLEQILRDEQRRREADGEDPL